MLHSEQKIDFPRYVYRRGTGRPVDENGGFAADGVIVKSQEELANLEGTWVDSPADAATGAAKKDASAAESDDNASKHHKKVK